MNRRTMMAKLLGALCAIPFVGKFLPKPSLVISVSCETTPVRWKWVDGQWVQVDPYIITETTEGCEVTENPAYRNV